MCYFTAGVSAAGKKAGGRRIISENVVNVPCLSFLKCWCFTNRSTYRTYL